MSPTKETWKNPAIFIEKKSGRNIVKIPGVIFGLIQRVFVKFLEKPLKFFWRIRIRRNP